MLSEMVRMFEREPGMCGMFMLAGVAGWTMVVGLWVSVKRGIKDQ